LNSGYIALAVSVAAVVFVGTFLIASCGTSSQSIEDTALQDLTECIKAHRGGKCYRLPSVVEAERDGWTAPGYYEILEGPGYHE
jgi:hypothetical protein